MSYLSNRSSTRFFLKYHDYFQSSQYPLCKATHFHNGRAKNYSTSIPASTTPPAKSTKEVLGQQTHYSLFPKTLPTGPPPDGPFAIDLKTLRAEFLKLQAQAHPDRHQGGNKARAEGASMRINEAYKTLQDPLRRAQYLLSLRGIDVAEDETARVEDPELLMEVLDTREEIEAVEDEEGLVGLNIRNGEKLKESLEVLERAFQEDDLGRAKEEAVKLRYWVNIKESLDAWERGKSVVFVH